MLYQSDNLDRTSGGNIRTEQAKTNRAAVTRSPPMDTMLSPQTSSAAVYEETALDEEMTTPGYNILDPRAESLFGSFATDGDRSLNFWPQLDCLPISAYSQAF